MEKLINDKIKELTENGELDKIVTKEATTFLTKTVSSALSSYGDVSKAFEEKLKVAMLNGIEKLDFVSYAGVLTNLVEEELNKSVVEFAIAPAREAIKSFIKPLEKTDWKLSEIIKKYIDEEVLTDYHYEDHESGEILLEVNKSDYGSIWIYFGKEADKKYKHDYRLALNEKNNLWSINCEKEKISPLTDTPLGNFNKFLFKLYAMKCKIEVDDHACEVEWYRGND